MPSGCPSVVATARLSVPGAVEMIRSIIGSGSASAKARATQKGGALDDGPTGDRCTHGGVVESERRARSTADHPRRASLCRSLLGRPVTLTPRMCAEEGGASWMTSVALQASEAGSPHRSPSRKGRSPWRGKQAEETNAPGHAGGRTTGRSDRPPNGPALDGLGTEADAVSPETCTRGPLYR